ncbi:hypothetical protein [Aliishimia ponticola]|uniref:hypothetical protein n=1 Tax=Aliishimia ponticola TaxID=2499833 RepID=UPI001455EC29|nr:hypothetical protein [Aliishimia ponticola]
MAPIEIQTTHPNAPRRGDAQAVEEARMRRRFWSQVALIVAGISLLVLVFL